MNISDYQQTVTVVMLSGKAVAFKFAFQSISTSSKKKKKTVFDFHKVKLWVTIDCGLRILFIQKCVTFWNEFFKRILSLRFSRFILYF